jgi:hypothetical protein
MKRGDVYDIKLIDERRHEVLREPGIIVHRKKFEFGRTNCQLYAAA